jgi:hypothetical protein
MHMDHSRSQDALFVVQEIRQLLWNLKFNCHLYSHVWTTLMQGLMPCVRHARLYVYSLLAYRLILKRRDYPFSAVCGWLFSIFAALSHIRPSPESAPCCRLTEQWPTLNRRTSIILWRCMTTQAEGLRPLTAEVCRCYQGCPRGIFFYLCPDFSTNISVYSCQISFHQMYPHMFICDGQCTYLKTPLQETQSLPSARFKISHYRV